MKLLHRASATENYLPWTCLNEKAHVVDSSKLDSNSLEPKINGDFSKTVEDDAEPPLKPGTESTIVAHDYNLPPRTDSILNAESLGCVTTSQGSISAREITQESTSLERNLENLKNSGNDGEARVAVSSEANESSPEAAIPSLKLSQSDSPPETPDVAKTTPPPKTSVSAASPSELTPKFATQSLSHFTSANIIALKGARDVCRSDLYEQHWLLKSLGRTDLPQHSSECGSYGDFLAYSGQSMTYILSNVDALLHSFLHFDDSNTASKVVWSYDFASIVDLFRKLRRIDMHPPKIFPSLWISAGKIYPISTVTNKCRSSATSDLGSISLDPTLASQGGSLNDVEACHVAKIILAALVASVPRCGPDGWLAVRKLHASGQVAPFIDAENSPEDQKKIGRLVRTLAAFENEMALSLVVRLARSIDIRYHLARARELAEDVDKYRRQFPPTFSRVIDFVNADKLKISITDNEGEPTFKNGGWIDPEIEPITWHPKEWPIIIEWLRAVILKEWDGKAKVAKGSAVGGALGLMLHIRKQSTSYSWSNVLC